MKVDYGADFSLMYKILYLYYFINKLLIKILISIYNEFRPHNLFSKYNQSLDKSTFDIIYM